jgi:membrane-bound serine protease (ClpP class)
VALVVLRMDTPGGLDTSMRSIIKRINASSVPVAVFVAPSGARAASAGTYMLYAAHIAAMAPGTNLGAATPVQLGGLPSPEPGGEGGSESDPSAEPKPAGMKQKLVNDAEAYLRGLAEMRGRNADWAAKAVREAASLPAQEALELGVIDLIAADVPELLRSIDGRRLAVLGQERLLRTDGMRQESLPPDWRNRLLAIISDPNIAYVLMLIGIYGLIYEFSNPGAVLPGTVGGICLLLALYAFHLLPVNYAGVALLMVGIGLMVAEALVPSFGALGIGGMLAFLIGSVILIDTDAPGYGIALPLIMSVTLVLGLAVIMTISLALKARGRPVVSGAEELVGATARVLDGFPGRGRVHLHGENWTARSEQPLRPGQLVEVIGRDGLTLLLGRAASRRNDP